MVEIVWRNPPEYVAQPYVDYLAKVTDSMPLLAWANYKDPTLWWNLADMNPGIICPDDLTFGTILHIPVIN